MAGGTARRRGKSVVRSVGTRMWFVLPTCLTERSMPKKLSWEEMGERINDIKKHKSWRKATKRYQTRHKKRVKRQHDRYNLKKNLKEQEEHPEKFLAKRKFWITQ